MVTKPLIRAAVLAVALTTFPAFAWGTSAKEVFAEVAASVVVVMALDNRGESVAQGSGVVVGDYEVVTNCHVLRGAAGVAVRQAIHWSGRESYRMVAAPLAGNQDRDLCLLFVTELPAPPAARAARLGSARALRVGDEVYAVGAPAGLELSLSRGVVSQLRSAFGKRSAPLVQTDAAISPGSSGGGLFNEAGELVGITTFKFQGENLNFAMPAEWVEELLAQARSETSQATARTVCVAEPNYDCVLDLALDAAKSFDEPSLRSEALLKIAEVQGDVGDIPGVRRTLGVAGLEIGADIENLAKIAIAQANVGDQQAADRTFSTLRAIADGITEYPRHPSHGDALGYLAAVLAARGQVPEAVKVISRIGSGECGHRFGFEQIIRALAEAGKSRTALMIASSIGDECNYWAFVNIAHEQLKAGRFEDTKKILLMPTDCRSISECQSGILQIAIWQLIYGSVQAAEQAMALLFSPDKDEGWFYDRQFISSLIQAKKGNFDAALATADLLPTQQGSMGTVRVALL